MDSARTIALASSCAAFVAVPCLGALLGKGERTDRYDTVITPPDYAFAVWGPIFAGCVASTVAQCRRQDDPMSRRTGWPLAGAYAVNTAWSVAAQSERFKLTPVLLPVATAFAAVAHGRAQGAESQAVATPVSTGLLLGWTALASTVNLVAGAVAAGTPKMSPKLVAASTAGLVAASAVVAASVARSRRGAVPFAVTAAWGLATTALSRRRPRGVRVAAGAGAMAVAAGSVVSSRRG
ncbi:hypothetical protein [Paractinoplanes lichenicola]|uniref:Tryptophan-rich sensory protein n=1 Tax=Paractinoplanes lichenicola TaxID=2802976 RepID=A0ABS1VX85_9ACTN|nr:hypothetical protein [Actinoplanes lichenicola]MBL7259033.1 hypothetical protein [Actinoplanes lichenicola]